MILAEGPLGGWCVYPHGFGKGVLRLPIVAWSDDWQPMVVNERTGELVQMRGPVQQGDISDVVAICSAEGWRWRWKDGELTPVAVFALMSDGLVRALIAEPESVTLDSFSEIEGTLVHVSEVFP